METNPNQQVKSNTATIKKPGLIGHVTDDLLHSKHVTAMAHGCNTHGVMGAGIARQVAKTFPHVLPKYQSACQLGDFVPGSCQRIPVMVLLSPIRVVFNLGTQGNPGRNADLEFIRLSFINMFVMMKVNGIRRVGIPEIGCGIGGLNWPDVEHEIAVAADLAPVRTTGMQVIVHHLPETSK